MAAAAATAATMLVNRSAIDLSELSRPDEPATQAVGFVVRVVVGGEIVMRGQEVHRRRAGGHDRPRRRVRHHPGRARRLAKVTPSSRSSPRASWSPICGGSVGVWRDNRGSSPARWCAPGTHIRAGRTRLVVALDLIGGHGRQSRPRRPPWSTPTPRSTCNRPRRTRCERMPPHRAAGVAPLPSRVDGHRSRQRPKRRRFRHRRSRRPSRRRHRRAGRGGTGRACASAAGDRRRHRPQGRASPTPTSARP